MTKLELFFTGIFFGAVGVGIIPTAVVGGVLGLIFLSSQKPSSDLFTTED